MIKVGYWVVAGRNADDVDVGRIVSLDCGKDEMGEGDPIGGQVAWAWSLTETWCPIGGENDVYVYATREAAEEEANRRLERTGIT